MKKLRDWINGDTYFMPFGWFGMGISSALVFVMIIEILIIIINK